MKNRKSYFDLNRFAAMILAAVSMIVLLPATGSFAANDAAGPLHVSLVTRHESPSSPPPLGRNAVLSKGKLLVAGRYMQDPRFAETVVLLVQYTSEGALGVIINRPLDVKLSRALPGFEGFKKKDDLLYWGGPVGYQEVAVLFTSPKQPEDSFHVFGDVYYSASVAIIEEMANSRKRSRTYRVYAGYAGWAPGQLEFEVLNGDWHIFQANTETIFEKESSDIWKDLIIFDSSLDSYSLRVHQFTSTAFCRLCHCIRRPRFPTCLLLHCTEDSEPGTASLNADSCLCIKQLIIRSYVH